MFKCINNKGFQMTFQNGWTVSIMFGRGNYCENNFEQIPYPHEANPKAEITSPNAEVWAWKTTDKGEHNMPENPVGWLTPDQVAEFIRDMSTRCHCGHRHEQYGSDHCNYCGCEEFQRTCDEIMPEGFDRVPA